MPFGENGGISATVQFLLIPMQDSYSAIQSVGIFDPTKFNDDTLPSSLSFKAEDIVPGRVPTVRRVVLTYRDFGPATITMFITVSSLNGVVQSMSSGPIQLGNTNPTFTLLTKLVDMTITGFRPQLSIFRDKNAGPVSIVQAVMLGMVERQQL